MTGAGGLLCSADHFLDVQAAVEPQVEILLPATHERANRLISMDHDNLYILAAVQNGSGADVQHDDVMDERGDDGRIELAKAGLFPQDGRSFKRRGASPVHPIGADGIKYVCHTDDLAFERDGVFMAD